MSLAEQILTRLSRDPSSPDLVDGVSDWTGLDPWGNLGQFPDLKAYVRGRDVLDFGCGDGYQSLACLEAGATSVVGVDSNPLPLANARRLVAKRPDRDKIHFVESVAGTVGRFDIIISQDAMEHFSEPMRVLALWRAVLCPSGKVFVTFGPPWLSPYGAHMHFFTRLPWVHLLFREKTVMKVRARYRNDGARLYGDVPGGLGKMTVSKFESMVKDSGFGVEWSRRDTVKGVPGAGIPLVREFVTNNIAAVLTPR